MNTHPNMRFSALFCKYYMPMALWLVCLSDPSLAAFEDKNISVRYHALAGSGCALRDDPSMMLQNPASSFGSHSLYLYTSFSKLYSTDIQSSTILCAVRYRQNTVNLALSSLGNELYKETLVVLGLCRKITSSVHMGLNMRMGQLSITRYGEAKMMTLDLGIQVKIISGLFLGSTLHNCLGTDIGEEPLPQCMQSGLHALLSTQWSLHFDIYKDIDFETDIRSGIEFKPLNSLTLRLGTSTQPSKVAAGFCLFIHNFNIEYGFDSHLTLGLTHQFAVSLRL